VPIRGNMNTFEITSLSIDERLQLIEALWESIAVERGQPELTDAQKAELDRRLEAHAVNPENVVPWEQVKADALNRARK
jgi:putative addiction module component (TIGR02574 family)